MKNSARWVVALGFSGVVGFTALLLLRRIGEASYITLLIVTALVGFGIAGFPRLRELDLRNLRLTLDQIEKARADVFATQEQLRESSKRLARLIAVTTAFQGVLGSQESHDALRLMVEKRGRELLGQLQVPDDEAEDMFKYQRAMERMHNLKDHAEHERAWHELVEELQRDADTA